MKINVTDMEKIKKAIDETEGKATARCLDPARIPAAIEGAEAKLQNLGIPKKYWDDCCIHLEPESLPNSYTFGAMGTSAIVRRFPSGWFLTGVGRGYCDKRPYGRGEKAILTLSMSAHEHLPSSFVV